MMRAICILNISKICTYTTKLLQVHTKGVGDVKSHEELFQQVSSRLENKKRESYNINHLMLDGQF